MLEILIKEDEFYNSQLNKIMNIPSCVLTLEHSLISVAKWESKWHIPYLSNKEKTAKQELDYIRCMVIGNIPNEHVFDILSVENILEIKEYIDNPMTATTFSKILVKQKKRLLLQKLFIVVCVPIISRLNAKSGI